MGRNDGIEILRVRACSQRCRHRHGGGAGPEIRYVPCSERLLLHLHLLHLLLLLLLRALLCSELLVTLSVLLLPLLPTVLFELYVQHLQLLFHLLLLLQS